MGRNDPGLDMELTCSWDEVGREWAGLRDTQVSGPRNPINSIINVQPPSKEDLVFIGHVRGLSVEPDGLGSKSCHFCSLHRDPV